MKSETVKMINDVYGEYKDDVIALSDKGYEKFSNDFLKSAKTVNDVIKIASIVAVMNGWREEARIKKF